MTFTVAATAGLKHRIEEHLRAVRMLLLLDEKARAGEDKLLLDQIALWKGNPPDWRGILNSQAHGAPLSRASRSCKHSDDS